MGYATSTDGISWIKDLNNPVINRGEKGNWDDIIVDDPCVLFEGSQFHMWYDGSRNFNNYRIGHLTSLDGIEWTRDPNNPVLDVGFAEEWDVSRAVSPFVIKERDTYHMWYGGANITTHMSGIGYASSVDGSMWAKWNSNPVVQQGESDDWDGNVIFNPTVLFDGTTYHTDRLCNLDWDRRSRGRFISCRAYSISKLSQSV
jgi:hypothetical protein